MSTETENRIFERLEELCEKFDRLDRTITGGDDPGKGMIVRIDRLEQAESRRDRFINVVAVAAVGGFVTGLGAVVWRLIQLIAKP